MTTNWEPEEGMLLHDREFASVALVMGQDEDGRWHLRRQMCVATTTGRHTAEELRQRFEPVQRDRASVTWGLVLNPMTGPCEHSVVVLTSKDRAELEKALTDEKVEPYRDGRWTKVYRAGGPLEWYNVLPADFDPGAVAGGG
jgi:hypothetical protein